MYSISRERARQVEKQLVKKLKSYLKKELGEMVEIALEHAA
jgi:DNA-directed RNA polymerase sigma subunit (sigma70/sigma32)